MDNNFREDKTWNNIFFTCSLIEFIARKTKNHCCQVCNLLGKETITKIFDLADVYHCMDIDQVADEFIAKSNIKTGNYDLIFECEYSVPSFWDIGQVYKRLIKKVCQSKNLQPIDGLIEVYNSFICAKIEDYNSSIYYESPENIFYYYQLGKIA